jgi:hypothetical protein
MNILGRQLLVLLSWAEPSKPTGREYKTYSAAVGKVRKPADIESGHSSNGKVYQVFFRSASDVS